MADPDLTPQQAAQALADLPGYEEGLTARLGGLTGMVWGVVSAAIFVSYGVAGAGASQLPKWALPFLWVPWTLAGIAITTCAWRLHALDLRRQGEPRGRAWPWSVGFTLFFLAALTIMRFRPLPIGPSNYMVVVNGLAAFILVAVASRRVGRLAAWPVLVAGLAMVAGAFALAALPLGSLAMAFACAALVGLGWIGSGLVAFVRG